MARRLTAEERRRFDLVPASVTSTATMVPVGFVPPGFVGITVGRRIMLRKGHEDRQQLLAHELVHVRQYQELGVPRFLARYLGEYARGLVRLRKPHAAYRAISFEVEAREQAARWAKRVGVVGDDHPKHQDADGA